MIPSSIRQLNFLHIDDFGNYRAMLKSILLGMGIENIENAGNAIDAMSMVTNKHYDVILCDYNLGDGQNGQQFFEELMHKKLLPYGTIYIMVTAENTMDMVMAAVEYRPDAYLNKPFPKEILISRLEKLLFKKENLKGIYSAYNNKDYSKALQLCDKKTQSLPKLALDIGKLKAKIAIDAEKYDIALSLYEKALSLRPFDWALYGKAQALFAKKDYDLAKETLLILVASNNNYIEAYDLLAKIYDIEEDFENSQDITQKAASISPRTVLRQQHLAKTALINGDKKTAEQALRQTITNSKNSHLKNIENDLSLANLYLESGHISKANKVLTTAKQEYKNDKNGQFQATLIETKIESKQGNEDRARELFEQVLNSIPFKIHNLPKNIQDELIQQGNNLGENEIVEAFINDIEHPSKNTDIDNIQFKRYTYLLINGKGMRLYHKDKLIEAMKLFEEAAENLPSNISVNMNAAQSIIMMLRKGKIRTVKEKEDCKKRARHYLDVCKFIDDKNEKYLKLEKLYNGLKF